MLRLVGFDLDGTLIRGTTCLEALAVPLGRHDDARRFMEEFDLSDEDAAKAAVEQAAGWFDGADIDEVCRHLSTVELAPGAQEAFALLRAAGVRTAIVSLTWSFAAEWYARLLGADAALGTTIRADGSVAHVLPADKGVWFSELAGRMGIAQRETAAVGDSRGDLDLVAAAGRSIYVGAQLPPGCTATHRPGGDLSIIARELLADGGQPRNPPRSGV